MGGNNLDITKLKIVIISIKYFNENFPFQIIQEDQSID